MISKLSNCKEVYVLTNIASVGKCPLISYFALNVLGLFIKARTQAALKDHY